MNFPYWQVGQLSQHFYTLDVFTKLCNTEFMVDKHLYSQYFIKEGKRMNTKKSPAQVETIVKRVILQANVLPPGRLEISDEKIVAEWFNGTGPTRAQEKAILVELEINLPSYKFQIVS
jgi:hypothetical protein